MRYRTLVPVRVPPAGTIRAMDGVVKRYGISSFMDVYHPLTVGPRS